MTLTEQPVIFTKIGRKTWAAMWSPSDTTTYRQIVGKGHTKDAAHANLLTRSQQWISRQSATESQPTSDIKIAISDVNA